MLEDALAGARLAQDQAQAVLLGVHFEDLKDLLLMRQQTDGVGVEGMALQAKGRTGGGTFTRTASMSGGA